MQGIRFAPLIPGQAAVLVFFVLSGVVLSLAPFRSLADGAQYDWLRYFPRRIVRLVVPMFTAITVSIPIGFVAWRMGSQSRSATAIDFSAAPARIIHDVFMQFDLLFNVSDDTLNLQGGALWRVDSPVWSMSWELWFSITLPLAVYCVARMRRHALAAALILFGVFISSYSGYFPLRLCLMFWLGVILAKNRRRIAGIHVNPVAEILVILVALAIIECPQVLQARGDAVSPLHALSVTAMSAACTGLVALAMTDGRLRRGLAGRPRPWLGRISFSLYLTHAIVMGGLSAVLPRFDVPAIIQGIVGILLSLIMGWLFMLLVERPSMRWSHALPSLNPR